jgi:Na+/proline symporter
MNLMTLPDFCRRRYGRSVELIASIIMVLSFSILLAGNMVAAGFLFEVFLGTSYLVGVFIIAAILLLYTMPGGLFSVVYTDVIQVGVALVGSLALVGFVFFQFGISIPSGMGPFAFE